MTERTCDLCGEPIGGGLQEHDFATCAHNLKDKVAQLEAENERLMQRYSDVQDEYLELHNEKALLAHELRKALGGES